MADKINVNQAEIEKDAKGIESAAARLESASLTPQDTRTTIPANPRSIAAHNRARDRIAGLGVMLGREVSNIRNLLAAFIEFDETSGLR